MAFWLRKDAVVYSENYATDDLIVGSNQKDDAGGTDRDKRMWFTKIKGAFRAGSVTGTQWDDANTGVQSAAFGLDCKSSGAQATAVGNATNATGQYSLSAGINTTASGDGSFAAAVNGTASGQGSAILGNGNVASGLFSTGLGGSNIASGDFSVVSGLGSTASGNISRASGASIASRYSQWSHSGAIFSAAGDAQINRFLARRISTNATPVVLFFDTVTTATLTGQNTNVLTIPVGKAHQVTIRGMARRTDTTGDYASFTSTFTITRNAAGNAAFITAPVVTADATAGAVTWTLVPTIDTSNATNNYLVLTATGEAAKTIRWAVEIATVEVG